MKQKVFIIFMLISLISLFLIACGQNGKEPVVDPIDPVEAQRRAAQEKAAREREEIRLALLEREKPQRIAAIKNATSVDVKAVLEKHNDENWKADTDYPNYFSAINEVFGKVPHKVDGGTEFLYNDATAGDRAKESKAARREVYLACNYFLSSINAVGKFLERLVKTPELVTKNKVKVKDFLKKIRDCAKAYYIDAHDTLQKKLSKLESLSGSEVKSLHDNLDELETARLTLIADVVEPFKNKYAIIKTFLEDTHHKAVVQVPADDIETYWNTLSSKFNDDCNEIIRLGGEIKDILGRAN
ncbi:putative membrane spanning protein [Borrelia duttonii CR2A]|uniref:Putative membrane spanning protein n=1 Tax=Borrelia duttonii CR2A TaxID=1432657 RepID=W6TKR5_9SPIR|nr:virulence associated lipoprotein [Borrelia duttonii]ETZ17894.1 putative membrane spanning protein [Borrelia duttonii CR2A]